MPYTLRSPETDREWREYFQLRWRILRAPWQQSPGSERDDMEDEAYHLMAIDENSVIVGAGRIHRRSGSSAQIRYMAVDPAFQGRGIGSQLLERLEAKAQSWGCQEIVLNARTTCLDFYLKHHYRIIADAATLFDTITHKQMRKQINDS